MGERPHICWTIRRTEYILVYCTHHLSISRNIHQPVTSVLDQITNKLLNYVIIRHFAYFSSSNSYFLSWLVSFCTSLKNKQKVFIDFLVRSKERRYKRKTPKKWEKNQTPYYKQCSTQFWDWVFCIVLYLYFCYKNTLYEILVKSLYWRDNIPLLWWSYSLDAWLLPILFRG